MAKAKICQTDTVFPGQWVKCLISIVLFNPHNNLVGSHFTDREAEGWKG